jgi:hypothetical protein
MADSSSSSSSVSSTFPIETPENAIIDQISGVASGMAGQLYNWAQGVFNGTTAVTNQAVGNFFDVSNKMLGLSNNMTDQYNNLFAPENAQLVADANSYASPARMQADMGMAGATQAQAGQAALSNSEEKLRSYGIDPSAGRYAALDKAAAVQNAANVAGAENQQRQQDIQTGQALRSQAVQVGSTLPQAIANVNNTAIQANAGASNASLANANTGANLMKVPNDYLNTAMNVKLPFSGSMGSSSSSQQSSSGGGGGRGGGGDGGGGGGNYGGGGGGNNGGYNGMAPNTSAMGNDGGTTYGGGSQPSASTDALGQNFNDNSFQYSGGGTDSMGFDSGGGSYYGGDTSGGGVDYSGGGDFGGGGDFSDFAKGGAVTTQQPAAINLYSSDDDGSPQSGAGAVPAAASPSGGQQVDDISAKGPGNSNLHLNANEFVIPQDVALWKGQEFFQKLINDSRKQRVTAPAKPTHAAMR